MRIFHFAAKPELHNNIEMDQINPIFKNKDKNKKADIKGSLNTRNAYQ